MSLSDFLSGATAACAFIIGLYFFKFYCKINDRFFLLFGIAFWTFVLEKLIQLFADIPTEFAARLYLVRLAGFLIFIFAIFEKNKVNRKIEDEK